MVKFPSREWAEEYSKKLNSNPSYQDAGKTWEGAITFVIEKDDSFNQDMFMYLDLHHGQCRGFEFSTTLNDLPSAEFKYRGPYKNWKKLINKEIDPIQGILTGKFKLEGSMMKIMRYSKAAKVMVSTASDVETEF